MSINTNLVSQILFVKTPQWDDSREIDVNTLNAMITSGGVRSLTCSPIPPLMVPGMTLVSFVKSIVIQTNQGINGVTP